jgi:hypothetical protein
MKLQALEEYQKLQTPLAYTLLALLNYQLYPGLETERQIFALFETVDIMKIYGSFTMEFRNLKASDFLNFLRHHKYASCCMIVFPILTIQAIQEL